MAAFGQVVSAISIHALLAESDIIQWEGMKSLSISIHALLAESDLFWAWLSPHYDISIHALLAESDREPTALRTPHQRFLSTLSLRRATSVRPETRLSYAISIHALLAESDIIIRV